MRVLVDTNIWSLALRRALSHTNDAERRLIDTLRNLVQDGRARMIGPIRQELLSGVRDPAQFEHLRERLRPFSDEALASEDYEQAAHWSNQCRARGIAGSAVDFLLCAVALKRDWEIFTTDADFGRFAKVIPIVLHGSKR